MTYRSFLLAVLLDLQLAVAVTAQYDRVVLFHSQVLATSRALLPLQMLPSLCTRKGLQNDGHIVLTCNGAAQQTGKYDSPQPMLLIPQSPL